MKREKILVLDNYDSFTYNLVHYIQSHPEFEVVVCRNNEITLEEVDLYDQIILSPGPGVPDEAGILKEVIRKYASTKKILGVCLGMQAIGEVFGGELTNLKTVYHGVSSTIELLEDDLLFKELPKKINVGRYHSWVISDNNFPDCLTITSKEENGQIMSLKHKEYAV